MQKNDVNEAIQTFDELTIRLDIDLQKDTTWPFICQETLKKNSNEEFHMAYWHGLESLFSEKEKTIGHCHKGQVYWQLALLYLQKGDITNCLGYLEKSVDEDRLLNPNGFSASMGMTAVLKPLLIRYKDRSAWTFDPEINDYYASLSVDDKRNFANEFFHNHNLASTNAVWVIKDDFFGFISDDKKRQVIFDTYTEVRDILLNPDLKTYYSCLFSIGSILEGMLDDLFERDAQKVWNIFHTDQLIQKEVQQDSKMASAQYNSGMTLGNKIMILRLMAKNNKLPMPKHAILEMLILGEYRDLIHPRRRLSSPYDPKKYVASFLFTMLGRLAGNWWPENIENLIKSK